MSIDDHFPPAGPCAVCCTDDARHRIIDAIRDRHRAGDGIEQIAADYGRSVEAVRAAVDEPMTPEEMESLIADLRAQLAADFAAPNDFGDRLAQFDRELAKVDALLAEDSGAYVHRTIAREHRRSIRARRGKAHDRAGRPL